LVRTFETSPLASPDTRARFMSGVATLIRWSHSSSAATHAGAQCATSTRGKPQPYHDERDSRAASPVSRLSSVYAIGLLLRILAPAGICGDNHPLGPSTVCGSAAASISCAPLSGRGPLAHAHERRLLVKRESCCSQEKKSPQSSSLSHQSEA
jgi:hypothetical protein